MRVGSSAPVQYTAHCRAGCAGDVNSLLNKDAKNYAKSLPFCLPIGGPLQRSQPWICKGSHTTVPKAERSGEVIKTICLQK